MQHPTQISKLQHSQDTRTHTTAAMSRPLSLFSIQAILILAIDDGSRILTKYYSNPHPPQGNQGDYPGQIAYKTVKDQKAFEKGLLGMDAYGLADCMV